MARARRFYGADARDSRRGGATGRPAVVYAGRTDRQPTAQEDPMEWSKPAYVELRFGFEITMYICTR